jgi:superfamily II DNA or RNA helicase
MKRYGYWQNTVRNKAIANFVKRVHEADRDAQILIIVATLEHAIALGMLLPWFKIAYYGGSDLKEVARHFAKKYPDLDITKFKMTQKQLDIMRAAFAKGTLKFVISTLVFRQGVSFDNLRVLVRADGAVSEIMGIQIPGRLARLHEGKEFGYLVDITDEGCGWTKQRAICREDLYQKQGWTKIQPQDVIHDFSTPTTWNPAPNT